MMGKQDRKVLTLEGTKQILVLYVLESKPICENKLPWKVSTHGPCRLELTCSWNISTYPNSLQNLELFRLSVCAIGC